MFCDLQNHLKIFKINFMSTNSNHSFNFDNFFFSFSANRKKIVWMVRRPRVDMETYKSFQIREISKRFFYDGLGDFLDLDRSFVMS